MKSGSPGFIGERLRELREARGLTGIALAEMLGVTRQAVSQYETGTASPSPDTVDRLCRTLNVPRQHFWRKPRTRPSGTVFYRSMSAATKSARTRAQRRHGWLHEITEFVEGWVELPPVKFPEPVDPDTSLTEEDIEQIADETRAFFGLRDGPIYNLVTILEDHGAIVTRVALEADTLDAFSEWSPEGRPYIILGSDKESAVRSRFDAAHELGHMVLHRHLQAKHLNSKVDFKRVETEAHRFAAAFLLPASSFAGEFVVPTLDALRAMKSKWLASIAMMIKRAEDLCLLPPADARRLWIGLARRGWRTREPQDDVIEVETPRVLRESFELLVSEAGQSIAEIRQSLPFSTGDIEDLAGLPPGFLTEGGQARVVTLRPEVRRREGADGTKGGEVVRFPEKPRHPK